MRDEKKAKQLLKLIFFQVCFTDKLSHFVTAAYIVNEAMCLRSPF